MVRAFGAGGSPNPNNAENSFLWARFNEYSIANMLKQQCQRGQDGHGRGHLFPNTNYWLRITRVGNTFTMFERVPPRRGLETFPAPANVASLSREHFAGLPLEVGIEQAGISWRAARACTSLPISA